MAGSCLVRVVGLMPSSTLWDLGDLEIAVDLCTTIHTLHGLQWLSLEFCLCVACIVCKLASIHYGARQQTRRFKSNAAYMTFSVSSPSCIKNGEKFMPPPEVEKVSPIFTTAWHDNSMA